MSAGERKGGGRKCDCGEEIFFVETARGRAMPVNDAEPERYYVMLDQPGHPQVRVILEGNGVVIGGRQVDEHTSGATVIAGWESHFGTCPNAAQYSGQARR